VEFILTQDWNDPKSRLQQCCLTLRRIDQPEPDVPVYRVLEVRGPTNSRLFQIGVYFRRRRLAQGVPFCWRCASAPR
jgi:ribonuclease-3